MLVSMAVVVITGGGRNKYPGAEMDGHVTCVAKTLRVTNPRLYHCSERVCTSHFRFEIGSKIDVCF